MAANLLNLLIFCTSLYISLLFLGGSHAVFKIEDVP